MSEDTGEKLRALVDRVRRDGAPVLHKAMLPDIHGFALAPGELDAATEEARAELESQGMAKDEIDSALDQCREMFEGASNGDPAQEARVLEMLVEQASLGIMLAWVESLVAAATVHGDLAWLRAAQLDADMLPLDPAALTLFDDRIADGCIVGTPVAMDVLRAIVAALPPGKRVPDELVAALDAGWHVTFIP